jgi:hypothetical protein
VDCGDTSMTVGLKVSGNEWTVTIFLSPQTRSPKIWRWLSGRRMALEILQLCRGEPRFTLVIVAVSLAASAVTVFAVWYWTVLLLVLVQVFGPVIASRLDRDRILSVVTDQESRGYTIFPIFSASILFFTVVWALLQFDEPRTLFALMATLGDASSADRETLLSLVLHLPETLTIVAHDSHYNDVNIGIGVLSICFSLFVFWFSKFTSFIFLNNANYYFKNISNNIKFVTFISVLLFFISYLLFFNFAYIASYVYSVLFFFFGSLSLIYFSIGLFCFFYKEQFPYIRIL